MSTIAAGQLAGLDRPSALEFSFLLSIPTMIAATGWDLIKEVHVSKSADGAVATAHVVMNGQRWIVLLIGTVVLFIVALGVVRVVSPLGPQARLHHVRHLPHLLGRRPADLGCAVNCVSFSVPKFASQSNCHFFSVVWPLDPPNSLESIDL